MKWLATSATLALFAILGSVTAAQADDKPVRVLFVLCGAGGHNVEVNTPPLLKTIDKLGGIQVTLLAPPKGQPGDGAHLAKLADVQRADYDVLVFYTVFGKLDPAAEKAIQSFVEDGGGLVVLHGATASFGNSKVWSSLTGGRFAGHASGTYDLPIEIVDTKHPITAGVEPFTINDEEYTYKFTDGVKRTVLARFKERPAKSAEKNGNNDILWTIEVGKGRVFHCGLGHDVKAWSTPEFQKLVIQGIYWAAGTPKTVTIPR
jgi:type 1 glutamine amidotransferase